MQLGYQVFSSPIGEILVAGTPFAITHVKHGTDKNALSSEFLFEHEEASAMGNTTYVREACTAISDYLSGKTSRIDVAIQLGGTEFQRAVWNALRQIPYGTTASYSEIAEFIGAPDAFRAVANACGDNPVPLIIPCHRVVNKSGSAGGFVWGADVKHQLLEMEKERAGAFAPA